MRALPKALKNGLASCFALVLHACTGVPDGIDVVHDLDAKRYLGKWYEIVRLDHGFEEGLQSVTAEYSLREDGGIDVVNRGYNVKKDEFEEANGKAYFIGKRNEGRLKVSFFGPFYGGYNIMLLDEDYQWSMVTGPDRDYFWILARTKQLDPALLERLIAKADELGFATERFIKVEHTKD